MGGSVRAAVGILSEGEDQQKEKREEEKPETEEEGVAPVGLGHKEGRGEGEEDIHDRYEVKQEHPALAEDRTAHTNGVIDRDEAGPAVAPAAREEPPLDDDRHHGKHKKQNDEIGEIGEKEGGRRRFSHGIAELIAGIVGRIIRRRGGKQKRIRHR